MEKILEFHLKIVYSNKYEFKYKYKNKKYDIPIISLVSTCR